MPLRACNRCGNPTDNGPHCTRCATPRASAHQRGYDKRWRRTRHHYLAEHPRCQEAGCQLMATDVDHIDGLGPLAPRGHDPANLRAYCKSHHSQRTARDQPGGFNT